MDLEEPSAPSLANKSSQQHDNIDISIVKEEANMPTLNLDNTQPESGQPQSTLTFLLKDLQTKEKELEARITVIDQSISAGSHRSIENSLRERIILSESIAALKQKQIELLSSHVTNNSTNVPPSSNFKSNCIQ